MTAERTRKDTLPQPTQITSLARRRPGGGYDVITVQHFDGNPATDFTLLDSKKDATKTGSSLLSLVGAGISAVSGIGITVEGVKHSDIRLVEQGLTLFATAIIIFMAGLSVDSVVNPLQKQQLQGLDRMFARENEGGPELPSPFDTTIPDMAALNALAETRRDPHPWHV